MTIREFYTLTGSDYEDVLERFLDEKRVTKFARMFLDDPCYTNLETALAAGDVRRAFFAAHTLKGVCLSIGFSGLYRSASDVTEALRSKDPERAQTLMEGLRRDYQTIVSLLKKVDGDPDSLQ